MSRNKNQAPNWAKDAIATKYGWEDPITGELLVSVGSLDLELIYSEKSKQVKSNLVDLSNNYDITTDKCVSVKEPVSANVETTLYDETEMMNTELETDSVDLDSMTKSEICAYAQETFDIVLNHKATKKSLIEHIQGL